MKLMQITVHFEFADAITAILDRQGISHYVRYPMISGKDREGKHYGTQVFPGNITVIQAQTPDSAIDALFCGLKAFRDEKRAHRHLEAFVLPIERRLNDDVPLERPPTTEESPEESPDVAPPPEIDASSVSPPTSDEPPPTPDEDSPGNASFAE